VTQQNAANAEESASASEELNAQAESMNDVVAELVTLVGGSSTKSSRNSNRQRFKSSAKAGDFSPKGGLKKSDQTFHKIANGKSKSKQMAKPFAPEKVIPLKGDDNDGSEDFSEFNG
ncbi:MAG: hypothetical protein JW837_12645, partial [Sedimentisphaerales bacterium]|nr:hypothetical protein [Sedimentisphaerales bacterium]